MGRRQRQLPERLPEKLKSIRLMLDLSQGALAERLNAEIAFIGFKDIKVYRGHIAEYEAGKREPFLSVLLAYSSLSKTDLTSLIDDRLEIKYKTRR